MSSLLTELQQQLRDAVSRNKILKATIAQQEKTISQVYKERLELEQKAELEESQWQEHVTELEQRVVELRLENEEKDAAIEESLMQGDMEAAAEDLEDEQLRTELRETTILIYDLERQKVQVEQQLEIKKVELQRREDDFDQYLEDILEIKEDLEEQSEIVEELVDVVNDILPVCEEVDRESFHDQCLVKVAELRRDTYKELKQLKGMGQAEQNHKFDELMAKLRVLVQQHQAQVDHSMEERRKDQESAKQAQVQIDILRGQLEPLEKEKNRLQQQINANNDRHTNQKKSLDMLISEHKTKVHKLKTGLVEQRSALNNCESENEGMMLDIHELKENDEFCQRKIMELEAELEILNQKKKSRVSKK